MLSGVVVELKSHLPIERQARVIVTFPLETGPPAM